LCLPRLLNLIECRVIEDLTKISQNETSEAVDLCLSLLEPVKVSRCHLDQSKFSYIYLYLKLHNAHQLAEWCMSYLCVNYNSICRHSTKSLKQLHPENQEYLKDNRWPPVWYLKDYDYYQRCIKEQKLEMNINKKNCQSEDNGCLCFSGGK
jgi:Rho-related BTB domain-containing protein 1/2